MDKRPEEVTHHILHNPNFVCSPAKIALAKGRLLTPNSFNPESASLVDQVRKVMEELLAKASTYEGALLVSNRDSNRLLNSVSPIATAVLQSTMSILGFSYEMPTGVLSGQIIGKIDQGWESGDEKYKSPEKLLITAHGPSYNETCPRFQPHPSLAVILTSFLSHIPDDVQANILQKAHKAKGSRYNSAVYFLEN